MTTFFYPEDTQKYVRDLPEIDNFGLRYTHFLKFKPDGDKYKVEFPFPKQIEIPKSSHEIIIKLRERQEFQLKSLSRIYDFRVIEAETDWRLIVGLGGEHVQETGMTLHHIYGIPYIPGSAIKGILHHWARKDKDEFNIFGSEEDNEQKIKGNVIFMDAFPVDSVNFAPDIINPHYPEYYGGKKYPADWQSPIPVNFLTVEKTKFRFIFLSKKSENSNCLDKITKWLEDVFELKGIGAKTAVGYGYFNKIKDISGNFSKTQ